MTENREHIYHAAMMDPHTAAELDLDQIWSLVDDLLAAHGDWLPDWARGPSEAARRLSRGGSRRRQAEAHAGVNAEAFGRCRRAVQASGS